MELSDIYYFIIFLLLLLLYDVLSRKNPFERTIKKNKLFSIRTNSSSIEITVYTSSAFDKAYNRNILFEAISQAKYHSPYANELYFVSDVPLCYNPQELNDLLQAYCITELYMSQSLVLGDYHITDTFELCNNCLETVATPKGCDYILFNSHEYDSLNTLCIASDKVTVPQVFSRFCPSEEVIITVPEEFRIRVPETLYSDYINSPYWEKICFTAKDGTQITDVFEKYKYLKDCFRI